MINDFIYDGKSLKSFGFSIKERPSYLIAERDMEFSEILGGEGSEILDNGGFKNVEINYKINSNPYYNLQKSDDQIAREIVDWLYNYDGKYKILRDTYNPGYFCYAICKNPEVIINPMERLLDTTITFSRKPYWYSDKGKQKVIYSFLPTVLQTDISLLNPEIISSKPYIKVEIVGKGDLRIRGGSSQLIISCEDYVEIDCANENIYKGDEDMNSKTEGDYFPIFKSGLNNIRFDCSANISKITIIPNWRRL